MEDVTKLFFYYLDQLWRRRWLALAFTWAVCILGWTFVAFLPDQYKSETRVYVDTSSLLNPLLRGISVNADEARRDQEVAIMERTLTSRPNLMKVAQMTDLDKSVNGNAGLQGLVDSIDSRIEIHSQGPNLFAVDYTDNSPVLAKNVVQALLTIFVENSMGNSRQDIQEARSFIQSQIDDYEKQLKASEQRLADFKVRNVDYFAGSAQTFAARLDAAKETRKQLEMDLSDLTAQRNQLRAQLDRTPQYVGMDAQVLIDGGTPLQQRIKFMEQKLDELKLEYTDKHPEVIATKHAVAELLREQERALKDPKAAELESGRPKSQVPNELYNQLALKLSDADAKVTSAQERLAQADALEKDLEKKAADAPRIEAEYTSINRDYEVLKGNYEALLQRRESARIAQAADSSTDPVQFRVISPPEVPAVPDGPKRRLFNVLVLFSGIAAGCGFVVLLTKIDDRVAVPEDMAEFSEFQVLGCVSRAVMLMTPLSFRERHGRFVAAATALGCMFALSLLAAPKSLGPPW